MSKKNNNKQRRYRRLACAVWLYCLGGAAIASPVITHQGVQSELFSRDYRAFDRYELIAGEMLYQEEDDDFFSKGFRPEKTRALEGEVHREVYDYPARHSAVGLYRQLKAALSRQGYQDVYRCEREACGAVAGWKLYWGRAIAGDERAQYYLAYAKRVGAERTEYVAAYLNELESQPRLVVERVAPAGQGFTLQINPAEEALVYPVIRGARIGKAVRAYDSAAAVPNGDVSDALRAWVAHIEAHPSRRYAVVGHSDGQGGARHNLRLSTRRAVYIRDVLVNAYGVAAQTLAVYGLGESQPVAANETAAGREQNRRIELVQLDEQSKQ